MINKKSLAQSIILAFSLFSVNSFAYIDISKAQQANRENNQVGANRQTIIVISSGNSSGQRRLIRANPGDQERITAGRAPQGLSFSHWSGDTRILNDASRRSQTIRVPRSRFPLHLTPIYTNGNDEQVAVTISGQGARVGFPGERVTIRAREVRGQVFLRWEGQTSFLEDARSRVTTVTLPDRDIRLRPIFRLASAEDGENGQRQNNNGSARDDADNNPARGGANSANSADSADSANDIPTTTSGSIAVISHTGTDTVRRQGDTLIGRVPNPNDYSNVVASIGDREISASTDSETGQFVIRLDSEELEGNGVTVSFTAESRNGDTLTGEFSAPVETDISGVSKVLSRVTFGATPGLKARFAGSGNPEAAARQYIRDQLNPTERNDRLVRQLEIDRLSQRDYRRRGGDPLAWRLGYAIYSDNQLREIMTEFWNNHFFTEDRDFLTNIRVITEYRENAFGNFRDLLQTSATNPAMMFYLNNNSNRRGGVNENYARELMELHTLGVDAGYGPEDVIAVARVKTGWTRRRLGGVEEGATPDLGEFFYDERRHDFKDKFIPFLNTTIRARRGEQGVEEGEELLDLLAAHPATRNFICGKLTQRFVADDKPQKYVDACVDAWTQSNGNMGEAVGAILLHEDYFSDTEYDRNKVRTPYEYMTNFMRSFNIFPAGRVVSTDERDNAFFNHLTNGLDFAGYRTDGSPDGNPEEADDWIAAGSLINNMRTIVASFGTRFRNNGAIAENENVDIDFDIFVDDARVSTAEGVADYMLSIATANSQKSDEVAFVADALKGPDGTFDPSNARELEADIRRAMTVIAIMPNILIQ